MTTVLLVEDDLINRELISRYLQITGYQVTTAVNGAEGVRIARAQPPDLILMDMGMPVMDGWAAVEQLRHSAGLSRVPIIALTAYAMYEDRDRCLAVGCSDYITKPIDFDELSRKIRAALASSQGV